MGKKYIILSSFLGLALGAVAGIFVGYYYGKNKYLSIADKEIESVRNMYEKHYNAKKEELQEATPMQEPHTDATPEPLVPTDEETKKYVNYAGAYSNGDKKEVGTPKRSIETPKPPKKTTTKKSSIYVISPDDFRDSEYDCESLTYYSDKVLADSDGNVIKNVNEVVGPHALTSFGLYEEDCVYVRDDDKKIDYEIIWSPKAFASLEQED